MRRPNRSLEVFSLSALDLFASALGAFIIISIMLFPYYGKKIKAEETLQQLEEELSLARIDSVNAQRKADKAIKKAASSADPVKLKKEQKKLKEAKAKLEKLKKRLAALNKQAKRAVPFALLGLPTKSNSFVLAVDMSGSMRDYTDIMLKALFRIIEPLDSASRIGIIGFGGKAGKLEFWPSEDRTSRMTNSNKSKLKQYINNLPSRFGGGTPTLSALQKALTYDVKSIVLLSDGRPRTPWKSIVDEISLNNKRTKEIHTVGIGDYVQDRALVEFLNMLAIKNKGNFVGMAR
ncbi:MAG: vWA domain-containing protein [Candidatus Thiodiazotropha taylori]